MAGRFKRTGQLWSPAEDEALLSLDTFWRNEPVCVRPRSGGRWALLLPHTRSNNLSKD